MKSINSQLGTKLIVRKIDDYSVLKQDIKEAYEEYIEEITLDEDGDDYDHDNR